MKKLILPALLFCLALTACGPKKIDLDTLTLKEDVNDLIKDHKPKFDQLEMLSALPGYLVDDTKGLSFGTVELYNISSVEYLLNSPTEKKLAGLYITFNTQGSIAAINAYLRKKYGNPTKVLEQPTNTASTDANAGRSGGYYLWSNIKPDVSMVLLNKMSETNSSELIILKNDITPPSPLNASTSLDRVIQNYTPLN